MKTLKKLVLLLGLGAGAYWAHKKGYVKDLKEKFEKEKEKIKEKIDKQKK